MPSTTFDSPSTVQAKILPLTKTVSNVSGAYTGTIVDERITSAMRAISIEYEDPTVFGAEVNVECSTGLVTITCDDVEGESDITILVIKVCEDPTAVKSDEFNILNQRIQETTKVGEIRAFGGSTVPSKWKVCDGSLISRTTYEKLFTALGTTWGGGDGETTFALPDMKGRTLIGVGENSENGHTAHTLGQMAGEEAHTLSVGELAKHSHTYKRARYVAAGGQIFGALCSDEGTWSFVTDTNGSSLPHNTMSPYACTNYIIYTGVEELSA